MFCDIKNVSFYVALFTFKIIEILQRVKKKILCCSILMINVVQYFSQTDLKYYMQFSYLKDLFSFKHFIT